jgi:tRNA (guanine10-N2)-methyltransferase
MKQREIIDSFSYLGFKGKIKMKNPEVEFGILEEWLEEDLKSSPGSDVGVSSEPAASITLRKIFLGRKIGGSRRQLKEKHDLKKRPYISTTSMDAELALITANLALAAPGKIFLDPFVGTGGFMVAAAELGALVLGSDIDGRSFRGKGTGLRNGVGANFNKYSLQHLFGDCMTSDLTNTPFRLSLSSQEAEDHRWLDGIVADPPYGVRESLKVLGTRKATMPPKDEDGKDPGSSSVGTRPPLHLIGGVPAHTLPDYIAPKKPYSFLRMLDDILDFAARTLVDGGRIAFWMPSANENEFGQEEETLIPEHRHLELKHECIQRFNKWSRRLLVYERRSGRYVPTDANPDAQGMDSGGHTADDLNPFRKMYFQPVKDRNGIE